MSRASFESAKISFIQKLSHQHCLITCSVKCNFKAITAEAVIHDAQVLLLTEIIRTENSNPLAAYTALEAQTAERLAAAHFFDLRAALQDQGPWDDHTMLVDQNHLSREGSARVGAALAPPVARLLAVPEPASTELSPIPATRFARSIGPGAVQ